MLRDIVGGETKLLCFRTLDPQAQIRLIKGLLDPQIGSSCDIFQLAEQGIGIALVSLQVVSDDLDIDWGRQAKVQDLADHVGRQECEARTWKLLRECQTKVVNVVIRGMMLGGKSHKNVGVRCADRSRIAVRKIDAAVGQTYVVNNIDDLACGNLPSNRPLDLIAEVSGFLDAHSGGRAQMN